MGGCAPVATYVGAVEQSRTRTPQNGQRARTSAPGPSRAPLGVPAGAPVTGESAAVYRAAGRTRRGCGLSAAALMFALGTLDWLLFDGSPTVYGVLFLPVCAVTALWVRPA